MKQDANTLGGKAPHFFYNSSLVELGRVVSHFDTHGCSMTGQCNSGIYYEMRSQAGSLDIYTSTATN